MGKLAVSRVTAHCTPFDQRASERKRGQPHAGRDTHLRKNFRHCDRNAVSGGNARFHPGERAAPELTSRLASEQAV